MHCQSDEPIPLKDNPSETTQHSLMDFPELAKKKAQRCRSYENGEKRVHGAPSATGIVPHENDILLGRGGKNNSHIGNEKLRELARHVAEKYHRSSKKEKSYLSRTLVQKVREMDPPGRFLRRHPKDGHWEDMSNDEDKSREKCAQVLRDAVAYVGLKEGPPPSMARREQQRQQDQLEMRRQALERQAYMQQPPTSATPVSPFARSADTSRQILSHQQHMLAASGFSFSGYNPLQASMYQHRGSLAASTGSYDHFGLRPSAAAYASMRQSIRSPPPVPQSIHIRPGIPSPLQGERPTKRIRRMSNPFFDPFAPLPPMPPLGEAAFGGYDRRLSMTSNSYPVGYEYASRHLPGPRVDTRRDSLFGNISLGARSDHSGPSVRDFELFPDITENEVVVREEAKDDNDEFSSDFY